MRNISINDLCQNNISRVDGGECKCLGGKNKSDQYINDLTKCMNFCCANYGDADRFFFNLTGTNKDCSYENKCSLARPHLHKIGFTITYKFQPDLFMRLSNSYK